MKTDKIYLFFELILIFTVSIKIASCTHKADISGIPEICFQRDVLPIFLNCSTAGCHDGGGESNLILNNYPDIIRGVVPGSPYSSPVYQSVIKATGENRMPPGQPLTLETRTIIRVWIEQGATGTTTCPAK